MESCVRALSWEAIEGGSNISQKCGEACVSLCNTLPKAFWNKEFFARDLIQDQLWDGVLHLQVEV